MLMILVPESVGHPHQATGPVPQAYRRARDWT